MTSFQGRIALHVFVEMSADIIPNYCYNSGAKRSGTARVRHRLTARRFIKPDHGVFFADTERKRENAPKVKPHHFFGSKVAVFRSFAMLTHRSCSTACMPSWRRRRRTLLARSTCRAWRDCSATRASA